MNGSLFDLVGSAQQPAQNPSPGQGIFDSLAEGAVQQPAVSQAGRRMAMQLAQSPTPQTARQIIQQLHQMKNPEAAQFEQILTGAMNDPAALKQLADAVLAKGGA